MILIKYLFSFLLQSPMAEQPTCNKTSVRSACWDQQNHKSVSMYRNKNVALENHFIAFNDSFSEVKLCRTEHTREKKPVETVPTRILI